MIDNANFNLYLIRHAQSEINALPDMIGQLPETPLTSQGKEQAFFLSKRFPGKYFNYVFSSTYTRAYDTAKIAVGDNHSIILAEELREYDAGDWRGTKRSQTLTETIRNRMGCFNHAFLPPNGESLYQVERRASKWLEDNILYNKEIIQQSKEREQFNEPSLNIAIFSHGMTIKCLLQYVMGFDRNFTWRIMLENTSISTLSFGKDGWKLLGINDYFHLRC